MACWEGGLGIRPSEKPSLQELSPEGDCVGLDTGYRQGVEPTAAEYKP